jgi:hypothetical protein
MNKVMLAALLVTASVSTFAHADLLTMKAGTTVKNGVTISTGATATVEGKTYDLTTVGSGLRNKRVIFDVPVYIAQLLVSDASRYVKTEAGALPSLDNETSVAIRLNFLRDVPADKVTTSFQDGLDANAVDAKDADIVQFMAAVTKNGDAKNSGSLTIFLTKNDDGTETLAYENLRGPKADVTVVKGSKGLTNKVLSIWLGKTADSGLAALKTELMK